MSLYPQYDWYGQQDLNLQAQWASESKSDVSANFTISAFSGSSAFLHSHVIVGVSPTAYVSDGATDET